STWQCSVSHGEASSHCKFLTAARSRWMSAWSGCVPERQWVPRRDAALCPHLLNQDRTHTDSFQLTQDFLWPGSSSSERQTLIAALGAEWPGRRAQRPSFGYG